MDIRLLPGVALTAVGQQLQEPDAASCRLVSRQLAAVPAQRQPGSFLQVVASSFQAQLRADKQQQIAARGGSTTDDKLKASGPAEAAAAAAAAGGGLTTDNAATQAAFTAGEQSHHDDDSNAEQAGTGIQQLQQSSSSSSSAQQPGLSSTAGSLTRAAAMLGYSCVRLHIDVQQTYDEDTWHQLFSALAACPSITSLEAYEYASLQPQGNSSSPQSLTRPMLELMIRTLGASGGCITPAAATRSYPYCNWLPSLVAHLQGQLQHLNMQLQAPLRPAQQPLLLQLQELRTLRCVEAEQQLPLLQHARVTLLPEVVVGLSALQQLRSLTVAMGPAANKELYIQAVIKLQHTFSQLGSNLTHLSFSSSFSDINDITQLQLSAPLNRMPALETLTCEPGFALDAEDILYPDLESDADLDPNGSSEAAPAAAAEVQLVPSLTRLVLNDGYDHGRLLQLLTQPSREGAAAAASRTLLQHLEFNSHGELPFELVNQLEGLRSLKFTAREKHDLSDFTHRAPVLVQQLQGLTLLCSQPSEQHDEWAAPYRPVPLLTGLASLTSLKVIGTAQVLLSTSEDLPLLTSALPRLQQLHFAGGFTQLRPAGRAMQVGFFGRSLQASSYSSSSSFVVLETPPQLTALTLLCKTPDPEEHQILRFMHGALPKTLRSLCIRGIASSVQAPCGDVSSSAAGWPQVVQDSSSSSRQQQVEGAEKDAAAAAAESAGGQQLAAAAAPAESADSQPAAAAAAESAADAELAALPLLERAEVVVDSLEDAADMFRLSSSLRGLALELRPASIAASMQHMQLADDKAAAAGTAVAAAALRWPPQLTSLRLCVPGLTPGSSGMSSDAAADGHCGLQLLLPSLSRSLKQLKQLALTCKNGPCLPVGAQQALGCLSSLNRLQTLELNFACCSINGSGSSQAPASAATAADLTSPEDLQQQQQQLPEGGKACAGDAVQASSSSGGTCCIEQGAMDEQVWVDVLAGLQCCSRLRQAVLGPERPIDKQQQLDLQDRLPNCLVYEV